MKKTLTLFFTLILSITLFAQEAETDQEVLEELENIKETSESLEIIFPENSSLTIGTCPVLLNTDQVRQSSREQAGIFTTKLAGVFSTYELAILRKISEYNIIEQQMQIERNIMLNIDLMYENINNIFYIDGIERFSYFIGLYGDNEYEPLPTFTAYQDIPYEMNDSLSVFNNYIISSTVATSYRLDVALDEAFERALTEISKYLDLSVRTMTQDSDLLHQKATLLSTDIELHNIRFSKILISRIGKNKAFHFKVLLQLKKEL